MARVAHVAAVKPLSAVVLDRPETRIPLIAQNHVRDTPFGHEEPDLCP